MKTSNANLSGVKVQLALVVMVAAASLFVISPAAAWDGPRKSIFVEKAEIGANTVGNYYTPTPRTTTCTKNATICLDPKLSPAGPTCCASKCVNTLVDIYNCGGCSRPCSQGWTCCKGVCKYTFTDSDNCGTCGHVCTKNSKGKKGLCSHGICGYNGGYY